MQNTSYDAVETGYAKTAQKNFSNAILSSHKVHCAQDRR